MRRAVLFLLAYGASSSGSTATLGADTVGNAEGVFPPAGS